MAADAIEKAEEAYDKYCELPKKDKDDEREI